MAGDAGRIKEDRELSKKKKGRGKKEKELVAPSRGGSRCHWRYSPRGRDKKCRKNLLREEESGHGEKVILEKKEEPTTAFKERIFGFFLRPGKAKKAMWGGEGGKTRDRVLRGKGKFDLTAKGVMGS